MQKTIAKNTTYITLASILQKVISFGYFTLVARHIGAADIGKYFFALSFTTVFVVFVDLGLTSVLVRESAKAKEKIQDYFSVIIFMKIVLAFFAYIAAGFTIYMLGYPLEIQQLVLLSAVTMLFDSFNLSLYGTLRAIGDLRFESVSIVGSQLLTLILGTFFLYHNYPLIFLILAFTIPSVCSSLFAIFIVRGKFGIHILPNWDKVLFHRIVMIAIPFALAAVFARVYSYADSLLLSKMVGNIAVGWYSIPYKIVYAFQFVPLALVAVLYPRFSEYFVHNQSKLAYVFERGMKYLFIIALPIAVGIGVLAQSIVIGLYTITYSASVLPLQILMGSLVFSFLSFPIGAFLNACNRQKIQTGIVGIVMIVNILVNFMFIPIYGVVGAAIAALVGNIVLCVSGYVVVTGIIKISQRFLILNIVQVGTAALVMGFVVYLVDRKTTFLLAIIAGVVIYPIMLLITRAVTRIQLHEAVELLKR